MSTRIDPNRRVSHGLGWPAHANFLQWKSRKPFFSADHPRLRDRAKHVQRGGRELRSSYIRSRWCQCVLEFLVTLDNVWKQNGVGWPPKTMRSSSIRACMHVRRCACACNLMLAVHSILRWKTLWLHCKWLLTITYSYECLNKLFLYVLTELQATNFVLTVTPNDQFGGWIFFAGDLHQNTSIVLQSENTGVFWSRRFSFTQRSDYFFPSQKNPYPLEDTFSGQQLKRGTYRLIVESVSQGVVSETSFYYEGEFRSICSHSFLSCLLILYQEGKRLGDLHCARPVFVRRKDSETLHASDYDVLCWYCLVYVRWLQTNSRKLEVARLFATLPGAKCIHSDHIIHRLLTNVCFRFFTQLHSETSASCAQGASENKLGGMIYKPKMFGKTRLRFLSQRTHFF